MNRIIKFLVYCGVCSNRDLNDDDDEECEISTSVPQPCKSVSSYKTLTFSS